jgi:hypothetical protein
MEVEFVAGTMIPLQAKAVSAVAADLQILIGNIDSREMDCSYTVAVPPTADHDEVDGGFVFGASQRTRLDIDLTAIDIGPNGIVRVTITIGDTFENENIAFLSDPYCVTAGNAGAAALMFYAQGTSGVYVSDRQAVFYCKRGIGTGIYPYNIGLVAQEIGSISYSMVTFYDPKIRNDG